MILIVLRNTIAEYFYPVATGDQCIQNKLAASKLFLKQISYGALFSTDWIGQLVLLSSSIMKSLIDAVTDIYIGLTC